MEEIVYKFNNKLKKIIRDKQIDIMLAIGIIMVVMGHKYQPPYLFFPAYTFHIGLFFFVSGYLSKIEFGLVNKIKYIIKKTKRQLIPYFLLNFLFAVITWLLFTKNIYLTKDLSIFNDDNFLKAFFVEPFISGHQYLLFIPAWFLLQLFVIGIVFQLINYSRKSLVILITYFVVFIVTLFLLEKGLNVYTDYKLLIVRTSYGLLFYYTGYLLNNYKDRIRKYIISPWFLVIGFVGVNLLSAFGGSISYAIVHGTVENDIVLVPLLATLIIILMTYNISYYLQKIISVNSIVYTIAKHTFSIMVFHLTVFFIINFIFYKMGLVSREELSDIYFGYNVDQFWLLYIIAGIFVPILLSKLYSLLIQYGKRFGIRLDIQLVN